MKEYQNEEWLRDKIEVNGLTHKEVSELSGVSITTISYFAKKHGVVRKGNTKTRENLDNAKKLKDREWLLNEYITLNKSYDTIASDFGFGKTTVARWVKRFGLDTLKSTATSGKRANELPKVLTDCSYCGKQTEVKGCRYAENERRFCSRLCSNRDTYENTDAPQRLKRDVERWRNTTQGQLFMREHGARVCANQETQETNIERRISELLTEAGIRFETQKKMYYWCVDFYLPEHDIVIEAQGDYWHAHPDKYPEPNAMQRKNIRRDKGKAAYIPKCGHRFLAFWERDITGNPEEVLRTIKQAIEERSAAA